MPKPLWQKNHYPTIYEPISMGCPSHRIGEANVAQKWEQLHKIFLVVYSLGGDNKCEWRPNESTIPHVTWSDMHLLPSTDYVSLQFCFFDYSNLTFGSMYHLKLGIKYHMFRLDFFFPFFLELWNDHVIITLYVVCWEVSFMSILINHFQHVQNWFCLMEVIFKKRKLRFTKENDLVELFTSIILLN